MGKREADADGIEYYYDSNVGARGRRGAIVYLIPCAKCGASIKSLSYGRNHTYLCERCRHGAQQKKKVVEDELYKELTTPGERRLLKAIDNIKKQVRDIKPYTHAIKLAMTAADKFGSIPEAMVAIELLKLGYKIIPQQRVNKYKVDFYLPDIKTIIEVDGALYHNSKRDDEREAIILFTLGMDTRVIHIPAERIAKNIQKLQECIDKLP